jgi:hypothetical protein
VSNIRLHSRPGYSYRQRILRLDPNDRQATALARACGTRRWTYNWALEQQQLSYESTGQFIGPSELKRRLVKLKHTPEYAWLQEVSKCAPEAAISDLHQALMIFLPSAGSGGPGSASLASRRRGSVGRASASTAQSRSPMAGSACPGSALYGSAPGLPIPAAGSAR